MKISLLRSWKNKLKKRYRRRSSTPVEHELGRRPDAVVVSFLHVPGVPTLTHTYRAAAEFVVADAYPTDLGLGVPTYAVVATPNKRASIMARPTGETHHEHRDPTRPHNLVCKVSSPKVLFLALLPTRGPARWMASSFRGDPLTPQLTRRQALAFLGTP